MAQDLPDGTGPDYPLHWEADVVLRDGGTAHVRPIRPSDADALQAFHIAQSPQSTYYRFFAPLATLTQRELDVFTHVDHVARVALVVVQEDAEGQGEQIIAVARYDRTSPGVADVAFNVSDHHQGRGLGSILLEHLAAAARERGIGKFTADVLPGNSAMLIVFREAGYEVAQRLDDGIVTLSFDIDPTDRSRRVMADREHRAEARSVEGILDADSVLVLVRSGGGLPAAAAVRSLLSGGFAGTVHLVGIQPPVDLVAEAADADPVVQPTVRVWSELSEVPGTVDLVLVDVAPGRAASAVRACKHLRPRAVVVLSGGYAELGDEGRRLQRDLVRTAHFAGIRIVGPSSYGVLRSRPGTVLNATLASRVPPTGDVGLFCQSAAMAVPLLHSAARRRLGLSTFLSGGHRADLSGNDMMQFWQEDPDTRVAGLYLESIGNPRKFSRVARRLAATKPAIVVTAGQSGHVIPAGHAVRRTRTPRRTLEALLKQSGVIRAQNTHQMLDIAQVLAHQPLPKGRAVGVLASSHALVGLVTEAVTSAGLTASGSAVVLPSGAPEADIEREVAALYDDPAHGSVVVMHTPVVGEYDPRVARAVARHAARTGRTTVACMLGQRGIGPELTAEDADGNPRTVPAYTTAEDAVLALSRAVEYATWRAGDRGERIHPAGVDRVAARKLVARWAPPDQEPRELAPERAAELLGTFGITVEPSIPVDDADQAVAAAEELGWPVVIKSRVRMLRHRADLGGIRLDISDAATMRAQVARLEELVESQGLPPADGPPYEVQRMAPPGVACMVRSEEDPLFGPVLSFGLSGDAVDLLGDVAYGIPPFTDLDVAQLVRSPRAAPRLFGYRGLPALDTTALEDLLGRLSELADVIPELRRVVLHPVVVHETGISVLSAWVHLAQAGRADDTRRALPG